MANNKGSMLLGVLVSVAAIATGLSTLFRALVFAQQSQRMAINAERAYYAAASGASVAAAYWDQVPLDSLADERFTDPLPIVFPAYCPDLGWAATLCLSRSLTYVYALARMPGDEQRLVRWRYTVLANGKPHFFEERIFPDL